jgi:hypothetical protein
MLRMLTGDDDDSRRYLAEVDATGGRIGLEWLTTAALTHLALIDVRAGDADGARDHLARVMQTLDDSRVTTLSACLVLAAFGHLEAARGRPDLAVTAIGAMEGLRERAGVTPWPNSRGTEAALRERARAAVTPTEWDAAYEAGSAMRMADVLRLVRNELAALGPVR